MTKIKWRERTWAKCFLMRYPHIKVRKAKNLSVACAMVANEINIQNWLKEYREVINKLHIISPEQIWSGDETRVPKYTERRQVLGWGEKAIVQSSSCQSRRDQHCVDICQWSG